ncbi:hypothetical protein K1719_005738 [Acacia pycnantha]|nr:hypothetical protein K1719_005738 [Acacia pycnantha]
MKSDSELWRNLVRIWPKLVENVHWEVGNGELADFWRDKWLESNGSLLVRCRGQLPVEEIGVKDSDWLRWNLTHENEEWRLIFGLTCWHLWGWRNRCCFQEDYVMPYQ